MTKIFGQFFFIIESHKHRGTIYEDPQDILAITVEIMGAFF